MASETNGAFITRSHNGGHYTGGPKMENGVKDYCNDTF